MFFNLYPVCQRHMENTNHSRYTNDVWYKHSVSMTCTYHRQCDLSITVTNTDERSVMNKLLINYSVCKKFTVHVNVENDWKKLG